MYNGSEADEVINVAVAVLSGTLSQEVVVRIYTMDSSALCKNAMIFCSLTLSVNNYLPTFDFSSRGLRASQYDVDFQQC